MGVKYKMPTCSFCKRHYDFPRGLTVFTFDGKSVHLCSGKCRKNLALKRDPRKVNWVRKHKELSNLALETEKKEILQEERDEEKSDSKK